MRGWNRAYARSASGVEGAGCLLGFAVLAAVVLAVSTVLFVVIEVLNFLWLWGLPLLVGALVFRARRSEDGTVRRKLIYGAALFAVLWYGWIGVSALIASRPDPVDGKVIAAYNAFAEHLRSGDMEHACGDLTADYRAQLVEEYGSCLNGLMTVTDEIPQTGNAKLGVTAVTGWEDDDRGVRNLPSEGWSTDLNLEGGRWRVNEIYCDGCTQYRR